MYRHPRVMASMDQAQAVVTDLFEAFCADPGAAAGRLGRAARGAGAPARVVRDYIAGMTDTLCAGGICPDLPHRNRSFEVRAMIRGRRGC